MPKADGTGVGASSWRLNKILAPQRPKYLVVGEILRPHGLRGELRMRVLTEHPDRLPDLDDVRLADAPDDPAPEKRALNGLRFNKNFALLSLAGCRNRNDAELLRGKVVMISIDQAAPLEDGQYYLFELIGLRVIADQIEIGRIREVLQTGANDVYIVESEEYGEVLVPAHDETIQNINFETGVITMALPEGLLPQS